MPRSALMLYIAYLPVLLPALRVRCLGEQTGTERAVNWKEVTQQPGAYTLASHAEPTPSPSPALVALDLRR